VRMRFITLSLRAVCPVACQYRHARQAGTI